MRETERVQIFHAIADLTEDAVDLRARHAAGHDDTEQIIRRVLHDLQSA